MRTNKTAIVCVMIAADKARLEREQLENAK